MNKITRKPYNYGSINYLVDDIKLRRIDHKQSRAYRAYRKGYINFIEFARRMSYKGE